MIYLYNRYFEQVISKHYINQPNNEDIKYDKLSLEEIYYINEIYADDFINFNYTKIKLY